MLKFRKAVLGLVGGLMGGSTWTRADVARHLNVTEGEVELLVTHHGLPAGEGASFEAGLVDEWRKSLSDKGEHGPRYLREVMRFRRGALVQAQLKTSLSETEAQGGDLVVEVAEAGLGVVADRQEGALFARRIGGAPFAFGHPTFYKTLVGPVETFDVVEALVIDDSSFALKLLLRMPGGSAFFSP